MDRLRIAGFGVSLTVFAGAALAASLWLTSAGCGGSGNSGGFGSDGATIGTGDGGGTTDTGIVGSGDGATDASTGRDAGSGTDSSKGSDSGPCTTSTGPIMGTVGSSGGSISRLVFAVAGDTRPADEDDPGSYPTSIITKIFQDIEAQSPHPPFVLGTGDYQFSSTGSDSVSSQEVGIYMTTRESYTGAFFPAMGNHECGVSGPYSTSDNNNCGPGNPGGVTPNYTAFMSQMLEPISQTNPYYAINVNAIDGSWTAKFVITAANSWESAQETWLETAMAQKTTYTFVVRHEASDSYPPLPPGVAGVDAVLAMYPYTLLIVGHAHTYDHYIASGQTVPTVVLGNGGAPLSSKDYGYGLFSQRCDGAIVIDEYDYMTGAADSSFHFVVTPDGAITK
jgi:hypothetical protein